MLTPQTFGHCILKGHALIVTSLIVTFEQMKAHTRLASVLFLLVGAVQAQSYGPYGQAVARQEYCELVVKQANMIVTGRKYSPKTHYENLWKTSLAKEGRLGQVNRFALDYAYDTATDEKDAQMIIWSYCMDKLL